MHAYVDAAIRLDADDRHARFVDARLARAEPQAFEKHRKAILGATGRAAKSKRDPNRVSLAEQARRRKAKG